MRNRNNKLRAFAFISFFSLIYLYLYIKNSVSFIQMSPKHLDSFVGYRKLPEYLQYPVLVDVDCLKLFAQNQSATSCQTVFNTDQITHDLFREDGWEICNFEIAKGADFMIFYLPNHIKYIKFFAMRSDEFGFDDGNVTHSHKFYVPKDLDDFSRQMSVGDAEPCNSDFAIDKNAFFKVSPRFATKLSGFRDFAWQHNVTLMIFGETLLSWKQTCQFIPQMMRITLAIKYSEFSDEFFEALKKSRQFKLFFSYGKLEDSFEFTLIVDGVEVLVHLIYADDSNKNHVTKMNVTSQTQTTLYFPKIDKICAGSLHDVLVYVPCNSVEILKASYGNEQWLLDNPSKKYTWNQVENLKIGQPIINDSDWKTVFQYYL